MLKLGVCLVLILTGTTYVQASWDTDPEWSFQTYLNTDFDFHCNDSVTTLMEGDRLVWHSPKGMQIMDGPKYELSNVGGVYGMRLKVKDIQPHDSGVYLCMVYRNNVFKMKVNRGLNLYDHKYMDMAVKYRTHILIGAITGAALFVVLVAMCCIYKCRFKTQEQREESRRAQKMRKMHSQADIEAMNGELPVKTIPEDGNGAVNPGFVDSTHL